MSKTHDVYHKSSLPLDMCAPMPSKHPPKRGGSRQHRAGRSGGPAKCYEWQALEAVLGNMRPCMVE